MLHSTTPGKPMFATTADPAGAFKFEALDAGDYSIEVMESEHAPAKSVFLKPGQSTAVLHFAAGQSMVGAVAALEPQSAITGHVTDADGEPIAGAEVRLMQQIWRRGTPVYQGMIQTTDERGEYRFSVTPGRYFVGAGVRSGAGTAVFSEGPGKPEMRVNTVMYPNSPDIESATPLEVRAGQQYGGIDFHLPTVVAYHVSGAGAALGIGTGRMDWSAVPLPRAPWRQPSGREFAARPQWRFRCGWRGSGQLLVAGAGYEPDRRASPGGR